MASASPAIRLRQATLDDVKILQKWDEEPHVLDADPNDDWNWQVELQHQPDWRAQLMAELDGRPIGFVQIIDPAQEESHYWGEVPANLRAIDIWIGEKDCLGKGYGTQMMRLALNICFEDPKVTAILIDPLASNVRAHQFYERLGFRFVQQRQFNDDLCFIYRLEREDWEKMKDKLN